MEILFLTNLLPYPLDNGGKIKTYTTLNALSEGGNDIDLFCFKEVDEDMKAEEKKLLNFCRSICQIYLPLTTANHKKYMIKKAMASLLSKLPFSIYKYKSKDFVNALKKCSDKKYDVIYFDHLPLCVYLPIVKMMWKNAKIILDEHNCEATITKRKAFNETNFGEKIFLKYESYKLEKFERDSILNVDKTIVLSNEDYKSLRGLTKKNFSYSIIPIGVQDKGIRNAQLNENLNILFVGTLSWEPNNAGLIWLLQEVLPLLEKKDFNYHLYIVGKNPSDDVRKNCACFGDKITITGYVESVDEYYDICDCTVVPLFIGSGQRVKLIEAYSKAMPAISTAIGAEGLVYQDGVSIIIANDKNKFADAILSMKDSNYRKSLGEKSREIYDKYYSSKAVFSMILEALD